MRNIIITVVIVIILFGSILSLFVLFKIKDSDPYNEAIEYIEDNDDIKQKLGSIEGYSFLVTGSIEESQNEGNATLNFKIKGERENANIYIQLIKDSSGKWKVLSFRLSK